MPKHFPFPWFDSILTSGDCDSAHIANLFDPASGLYHDLQSEATPAFKEGGLIDVTFDEGFPPFTCTFTVTLARASGLVPLSSAAFTAVDELGHLHHLKVTTQQGKPPPADIAPGQTTTLIVRGTLPTGSGQLRWAPEGPQAIVSWDFDVEID